MARSAAVRQKNWMDRLARLGDESARQRFLRRQRRLHTAAAVQQLSEESLRLAQADLPKAMRLAEAATWLAEQVGQAGARAHSGRALGHLLFYSGDYLGALLRLQAAMEAFERLGEEAEVVRTILGPGLQALAYIGEYERAFALAEKARALLGQRPDPLCQAELDRGLGNLLNRQGRLTEALACYQRAYQALLEHGGGPQELAAACNDLADCHISLNRFPEALDTYRRARQHAERRKLHRLAVETDYHLAYLYYLRGEYGRALEQYESTRRLCQRLGDPRHRALCDLDQAEIYLELNLTERGAEMAERALAAFRELGMDYEAAKALAFRGIAASQQDEPARALEHFDRARPLFVREQNRLWPALLDFYKALALTGLERAGEARPLAEAALAVFAAVPLPGKAALCELLLTRLDLRAGQPWAAHQRCLSLRKRLETSDIPAVAWQVFFVLGQVHEALGEPRAAHEAYRQAHACLEDLRSHLRGEEPKIAFLTDKLAVYESLVWISLHREPGAAASAAVFEYIEQAKSRSLADLIAFQAPALGARTAEGSALAGDLRELRRQLNWTYHVAEQEELHPGPAAAGRQAQLRQQSRELEDKLLAAFREMRSRDQEFSALQDGAAAGLDAVRAAIPADALLLAYYQARGILYACRVDRQSVEIVPAAPLAQVRSHFRLLQFQLSKARLWPEYTRLFTEALQRATSHHLQELYTDLIAPVRERLHARHLIIVPHGFLHHLPFHALGNGERYLVDDFSISYAPSASVYALCVAKPAVAGSRSLVLGVPDAMAPHIREEAEGVAAALPGSRLFLGEEATEELLRASAGGCRYLHIATHGLFRQDNPMFSSIRLGRSHLCLFDLYQMDLPCELVTLSGCGTGLNVVVGGDELLGLVRGLLYAGARSLLVTLWDVNDESTTRFMKCFYRRLAGSPDKAVAMQQAMGELRQSYPHPYHWAPFCLVGRYS